jgi:hypothetical protein
VRFLALKGGGVKELVYHRMFFSGLRRFEDQTAVIDGSYRATFGEHADRVLRKPYWEGRDRNIS